MHHIARTCDRDSAGWSHLLLEVVKISRPGFYLTHLWFYGLPFAQVNMFGSAEFWVGACYVTFPLGLLLYGWNDLFDEATDANNPRKDSWLFGANPDAQMRRRLPYIIAAVQLPFWGCFVLVAGPKMILWISAVIGFNWLYNNLNLKGRPFLDLINQVGYLLIFVLASWLCDQQQLNSPAIVFSALFAMQSHLFGQIMDLDEDRLAGRCSTAILLGPRSSKVLLVCLMLAEACIAWSCFRSPWVGHFMALGSFWFLLDAWRGPERYSLKFVRAFFVGWNLVALVTIHYVWKLGLLLPPEASGIR